MIPETVPGFEETDTDRAYQPVAGCCADCDDELDFAGWQQELAS